MSKHHAAIFAALLLSVCMASAPRVAAADTDLPPGIVLPPDIKRLLTLPEGEIDVGVAALTFAKEFYPQIDISAYSNKIDLLADKVGNLVNGSKDPETRIQALNTVLFHDEGFHYDKAPDARRKQQNYFLNRTLDTKEGICYTLPLLYIAVAQRLGYPVYPVLVPDHLFVRYVDPSVTQPNIEVTSGGKRYSDASYIEDFAVSQKSIDSGSYMRILSYHEFLATMVEANALMAAQSRHGADAVAYEEIASHINPKDADIYHNLQQGYLAWAAVSHGLQRIIYRAFAAEDGAKAEDLGFVSDDDISFARSFSKPGS